MINHVDSQTVVLVFILQNVAMKQIICIPPSNLLFQYLGHDDL